jgi:hypothetical protein
VVGSHVATGNLSGVVDRQDDRKWKLHGNVFCAHDFGSWISRPSRLQMQVLTHYLTYYETHLVGQLWTPRDLAPL